MFADARSKVMLFIVGVVMFSFGTGTFFQTGEVDAHPHLVVQTTITWTAEEYYYSYEAARVRGPDDYGHTVYGSRWQDVWHLVRYTEYIVDDGHTTNKKTVKTDVPNSEREGFNYIQWDGCGKYECAQYVTNSQGGG